MRLCPFCAEGIGEFDGKCASCGRELPAETYALEMPLCYTHTCKVCNAKTTVYDHSYWTLVACERCGESFLANPPMIDTRGT